MKKFLIVFLLLLTFLSGCKKSEKAAVFFSGKEIARENISLNDVTVDFKVGQKINFIVFTPIPFKCNVVKSQILKITNNPPLLTPSIVQTKEIEIDITKNYFISSFVLHKEGYYVLSIYEKNNLNEPIVRGDFKVN